MTTPVRRTLGRTLGAVLSPSITVPKKDAFWDDLCIRIKQGTVIPIISNTLYGDSLFTPLFDKLLGSSALDTPDPIANVVDAPQPSAKLTVDEQLAEFWAGEIGYPLRDLHSLARVAQYNLVKSADMEQAKRSYLDFLKEVLLKLVETTDPSSVALVQNLRSRMGECSFSDLVSELDLPSDANPDANMLRLLARLNLPVYVTTSYYDFLERAIAAEGRKAKTQICGDLSNLQPAHRLDRDFIPTQETPVVYHLHGLESYPSSLVLSEDDYMKFLVRITQPVDPEKPVIPLYLNEKLAESTLLLLGYRLSEWDFRATFRGLITAKDAPRRFYSLAIQLSPQAQGDVENPEEAQNYLTDYFKAANFRVIWDTNEGFVQRLWDEWNRWRRGGL